MIFWKDSSVEVWAMGSKCLTWQIFLSRDEGFDRKPGKVMHEYVDHLIF